MRSQILLLLMSGGFALQAADFQDYQAARAVIGQSSFSAREKGVNAIALSLSEGKLNVADTSGYTFSYDLARIGAVRIGGCSVCLTDPKSATPQSVIEGVAAVSENGSTIAVADPKSRSVMIWNGLSVLNRPSVTLTGFVNPVAVTLDKQRLFVADAGSHHVLIWDQIPAYAPTLPDVVLGVSDDSRTLGPDSIITPSALATDGENLYVADKFAHRILVFSASEFAAPETINAATLKPGPVAPGTLVSIDHAAGASAVFMNGQKLKTTDLNGDQLQFQIPYDLSNADSASIWLQNETGISRAAALRFAAASPGLFAFGLKEPRTGMLLHAPEGVPLSPDNPARPSEILKAWATGLGAVAAESHTDGSFNVLTPVRALVNGEDVEVLSAVLPADSTGVYELQLRLPSTLAGEVSLAVIQNESKSNIVTFPIANK